MNRKKTYFFIWGFVILIFFLPIIGTIISEMQLNPLDYARITDVDYTAVVGNEGTVVITERLTFDIHAASHDNLFWELWRDLPEDEIDGLKLNYEVNSVKQILPDGSEIIYDESPRLYWEDEDYLPSSRKYGPGKWFHSDGPYNESARQYECIFFYVDGLYREEIVFEIEYEMNNAALRYNDCSDLYLSLYSETTVNHLESLKAQILFPNENMPARGNYEVYTYGTNSHTFPVEESATANPGYYTFSFELDEEDLKFKPYNEYIEFDLVSYGEDKHIFTEYAPSNDYSRDDVLEEIREEQQAYANAPARYKNIKTFVFVLLTAGSVYLLIYAFRTDARMRSKHVFYEPSIKPDYYRDIPSDLDPNFAATLVFSKHKAPQDDSGIYSALLLSLARKKYIELKEWHNDDTMIILKKLPPKPAPVSNNHASLFGDTSVTGDAPMFGAGSIGYYAAVQNADTAIATPGTANNTPSVATAASTQATDSVIPNTSLGTTTQVTDSISSADSVGTTTQVTDSISSADSIDTATQATIPPAPETIEEPLEPLSLCEEYYYNLLVRHVAQDRIMMSYFQERISADYLNTDAFAKNIEHSIVNIGVKDGYFQKADYAQPKKKMLSTAKLLLVIGIIALTLVNIISCTTRMDLSFGGYFLIGICCILAHFLLKKQADKYILLTQFGEDEYAKWRGLYNFLNSETLMNERTVVELPLWEKYLVYATAFGISEKVIKAIGIRCPELTTSPENSSGTILHNNYYRSGRYRRHGRSFRSAVRSGSHTARSGGSFGGGGFGYGGGGRGGGGGGGGH